ncbi:ATP-binding protein [Subtercola endophyticus]|uniref:ATP-binding protein n=1 Tax=Subtercola endophyticus TaxID=2895559 RepID=UPI001E2D0D25|nr:ATP-binding protein [Subtercola endophyticus]UFS59547.1 HAMP domain-containing histidine kinase [Subtercola endophyticus]
MIERPPATRRFTRGRTRIRITAVATLVAAAILVPAGLLGYTAVAGAQQAAVQATALAQAQSMTGLLSDATLPANYQGDLPYEVSTQDGRILATSGDLTEFQTQGPIAAESWDPLIASGDGFLYRETTLQLRTHGSSSNRLDGLTLHTIDAYTDIGAPEAALAGLPDKTTVRVIVVMTPIDTNSLLRDTQTLITIAVPAAVVVLAIAVWFSVGSALQPIARMSRRVNTITSARLGESIPVPRTADEVQELAITLNSLLSRLDRSDALQRGFLDDAAHELRSPITSLLTTLEVAERYPDAVDWFDTLAAAIRQARRLQLLSDDLLLLTSLESEQSADLAPVDFGQLIGAVADQSVFSHTIARDIRAGITVRGRERDLERLVSNLLDNADRHAATRIDITLARLGDGSTARLTVRNDGPPLPAGSEERIFDRLVRLDSARDSTAGGTGLGLAIARQIAHNHHAHLSAVPRDDGAEFRLDIPTGPPEATP